MKADVYSDEDIKAFALDTAKMVWERSYNNGSSVDTRRNTTPEEAALLARAVTAALCAIRAGYDETACKSTAEYFVLYNSGEPHINTYDSVYLKIDEFLTRHKV